MNVIGGQTELAKISEPFFAIFIISIIGFIVMGKVKLTTIASSTKIRKTRKVLQ